jgi:hypothetical protein
MPLPDFRRNAELEYVASMCRLLAAFAKANQLEEVAFLLAMAELAIAQEVQAPEFLQALAERGVSD